MAQEKFKYNININQAAVIACGLDVDIIDMAIFDFIKDFALSKDCMKVQAYDKTYYWIAYSKIMEQLPLIGISTNRGISKRIDKLIESGLLERHPNNQELGKTMYAFGNMYDRYIFCTAQERKFQGGTNESSEGVRTNIPTPTNESSDNNNTIYNNTKDNITNDNTPLTPQGEFEEVSQEELMFEEFRKVYLGRKRGCKTEFDNLKKKHRDWREVLSLLKPAYERQCEAKRMQKGKVDPQYEKNLQTYINQRCWEEEVTYDSNQITSTTANTQLNEIDRARQNAINALRSRGINI